MKTITKIIHVSDIHIKSNKMHKEYKIVLDNFIENVKRLNDEYHDEIILIIAGDLVDNFLTITNELEIFVSGFLKELDSILPTFIIAGNHDLTKSNILNRVDTLTPFFKMVDFKQTIYLDMALDYKSGWLHYYNINFILYSIFDNYNKPEWYDEIKKRIENIDDCVNIGLCHAPVINSSTDIGFAVTHGIPLNIFDDNYLDMVILGDIHKHQILTTKNKINCYYSGSLLQLNFGESLDWHGYNLYDIKDKNDITMSFHEVENPFKYFVFEIG